MAIVEYRRAVFGADYLDDYQNFMGALRDAGVLSVDNAWSNYISAGLSHDDTLKALEALGKRTADAITEMQALAVRNTVSYLGHFVPNFGDNVTSVSQLLGQGRVGWLDYGDYAAFDIQALRGVLPRIYENKIKAGASPDEALAGVRNYVDRVARTDPYRVANDIVTEVGNPDSVFGQRLLSGYWRRVLGPGACVVCIDAAGEGWTHDYTVAAAQLHPNDNCTVEPQRKDNRDKSLDRRIKSWDERIPADGRRAAGAGNDESDVYAKRAKALADRMEPGISDVLKRLALANGAEIAGLNPDGTINFSKKGIGSLSRKILGDSIEDSVSLRTAAANIKDSVRYTMLFTQDNYMAGMTSVLRQFEEQGYTVIDRGFKPTWDGKVYKGLNTNIRTPDGKLVFELQFHTPESFFTKQYLMHDDFELARVLQGDSPAVNELKRLLDERMASWSKLINVPAGAAQLTRSSWPL